uniref:Uncharacterized protein n=1 Tax=Anguilla anguilla TaxID=7936 RepID=A0A0E9TLK4_ANGAN
MRINVPLNALLGRNGPFALKLGR